VFHLIPFLPSCPFIFLPQEKDHSNLRCLFTWFICPSAAKMIPLFMMFAGGPLGTGRQWLLLSLVLQTYSIRWDPSHSVFRQMGFDR
jgi:hypothetical protein